MNSNHQIRLIASKDRRADIALIATILGAAIFTIFSAIMVYIIWRGGWSPATEAARLNILGKSLMISLAGSLLVIITLGFAINHRLVRVTTSGIEAEGGDVDYVPVTDPPPPARMIHTIEEY